MGQLTIIPEKIKKIVKKFNDTSIIVVGDIMLDEYLWGM